MRESKQCMWHISFAGGVIMVHRKKIGDVFAIPLPDDTYAFGRLYQESCVAFYKHKGDMFLLC